MAELPLSAPVGVVGAGTMGSGIAQVALVAGHQVRLYDVLDGAAARGVEQIHARLDRLVAKGTLSDAQARAAKERLTAVGSLDALSDCGLVIEAVVEQLPAKRELFAALEKVCADDTILATNTSTISVTAIAAGLRRPERVTGMHFFNPAPLMALVEVPAGATTDPTVAEIVAATAAAWGKTPVRCASTPGFVANRIARPFYGEAMQVLEERGTDCATIDAVLREAGGFPMGPFELADLVGNDVNLAVGRSVWEQTFGDPRYAPFVAQQQVVDAGWLGRKAGRGWYAYDGGDRPAPHTAEPRPAPERVTYHGGFAACYGLLDRIAAAGVSVERYETGPAGTRSGAGEFEPGESAYGIELPGGGLVLETVGEPATVDGDAVALDWVGDPATASRVCLAPGDACEPATLDDAIGMFQAAGLAVSVIDDVPGLIVARTICMLVNEAVDLVARGEAAAADVDTAMRLGTGYPRGPLEWGDRIGSAIVAEILSTLARTYPSGRYRPSPQLIRAAHTGRPLRGL
ncbi:3-hydroxyacyl-CoA dehydrogenase [Actinopolymorpha alba]|uniref:3-hydroxyacyl-CoA dehydrogenase n=1 Tax=Actinopolymorpha alba TaxID=533267 RepID=UPI00039AA7FD|nr:3-hydroxyacyl-CoA dehydrogenase [Actinopolymorpha alba]